MTSIFVSLPTSTTHDLKISSFKVAFPLGQIEISPKVKEILSKEKVWEISRVLAKSKYNFEASTTFGRMQKLTPNKK